MGFVFVGWLVFLMFFSVLVWGCFVCFLLLLLLFGFF